MFKIIICFSLCLIHKTVLWILMHCIVAISPNFLSSLFKSFFCFFFTLHINRYLLNWTLIWNYLLTVCIHLISRNQPVSPFFYIRLVSSCGWNCWETTWGFAQYFIDTCNISVLFHFNAHHTKSIHHSNTTNVADIQISMCVSLSFYLSLSNSWFPSCFLNYSDQHASLLNLFHTSYLDYFRI